MAERLAVELYGVRIGSLTGSSFRTFDFEPSARSFETFGVGSTILSESVPLDVTQRRGRAEARRNYFGELLPEGDQRRYLAEQAGIAEYDTIAFLTRYGRDVAGALQIWNASDPGEPRTPFATAVSDADIARLLTDAQEYPLGNVPETGKSLINGVQLKIVLAQENGAWLLPADGYPSTHILKPQSGAGSTVIFDEEYGARIARGIGLANHDTHLEVFQDVPTLVIQRYDRSPASPNQRIHQEDMAQALGFPGSAKYQKSSGQASLARIAALLRRRTDSRSVQRFAQLTVLAVAVGNLDMHAKNVSLLHPWEADTRLAPAYDVVPMTHLDNDHELALAVNDVYQHAAVTAEDLKQELSSWGLRSPSILIRETLERIQSVAASEAPEEGAHPELQEDIRRFTANLLAGLPAGVEHNHASRRASETNGAH